MTRSEAWQRFQEAPRAFHWLAWAGLVILVVLVWDKTRIWALQYDDEANAIEASVATVRNASELSKRLDSRGVAESILSIGPVEVPGGRAEGEAALRDVVTRLFKEHDVKDDTIKTRTGQPLKRDMLRGIAGNKRIGTYKADLEFTCEPPAATAIIAALESNPAVERIVTLSINKDDSLEVAVKLSLEAWVIEEGRRP